ncbi:MAG: cysteine hydrolase family protein [Eubacterium sp.]
MRKILIVIDMQNDFIDGALGTKEAEAIVPAVIEKIRSYAPDDIYATRDTHSEEYPETQEGRLLPVPHCIRGTDGWQIRPEIMALLSEDRIIDKPSFGSPDLAETMKRLAGDALGRDMKIELCGLCTDICVVSNALLIKAFLPEAEVRVDPACCAGVTPEAHEAALSVMRSCQVLVG